MKVAVIGAGIIGVTTAYELAALGHEVVAYERAGVVAAQASFANAGSVVTDHVAPWAAPGMPLKVLQHLLRRDAAVRLGGAGALAEFPWMWRWWRACRPRVYAANRRAMQDLAQFSRDRLLELTRTLHLEYEQSLGFVVLLRRERDLKAARSGLDLLRERGVPHAVVDGARCRQIEPGLNPEMALHAAIHLPQDGVGNCRHFAHLLKAEAQKLGTRFRFDTPVTAVAPGTRPTVTTLRGECEAFDAVVVCAGVQANDLLRGLGLRLPLAAIYGYSVTAPLRHLDSLVPVGPRAALVDGRYQVVISRLGQRVRVSGCAEIGGRLDHQAAAPLRALYRVLDDWFPGVALAREAQHWKGARPMFPDGAPVLGESGAPGVWLNLGHGSNGWALACGSARTLAERISGRTAPVDTSRLTLARLR
jgi:D-amino-acid dehydrogenase